MPSFADVLKQAKVGRVQIVHEFLTNYDPSANRIHCFYEGREDEIFYRAFIQRRCQSTVLAYICGSKDEVYAVFSTVSRHPGYRQSLFFVDKDLSDILGETRIKDPRLFVTSYYSVENYLVTQDVFERFCRDFVQFRGLVYKHQSTAAEFGEAQVKFYRLITPVMAWIVAVRRAGQRPNLKNIKLKLLFGFDENLEIARALKRGRVAHLCTVAGVVNTPGLSRAVRAALVEMHRHEPKKVIRGHFESWFFVEYIKAWFARMKAEAEKCGGSASMNPPVEHSSFVALSVPTLAIPPELDTFLAEVLKVLPAEPDVSRRSSGSDRGSGKRTGLLWRWVARKRFGRFARFVSGIWKKCLERVWPYESGSGKPNPKE